MNRFGDVHSDDEGTAPGQSPGGAPRTYVDAPGGAPRTYVDAPGGAPRTRVDAPAGDEEVGAASAGPHIGINLPPPLAVRFRVVRELAPGAEADVVEAVSLEDGRRVAIKVFRSRDFSGDVEQVEALDRLPREYVIDVQERGHHGQKWWEVMPYLPHGSIADVRALDPRPWSPAQIRDLVEQLTRALTHVHAERLVHRDVKPQNLLVVTVDPLRVVLGDFGLARVIAATREQHSTSRTIAYAPPEATAGVVSAAWDWWSLGMTVLELLRGAHPFQEPGGRWMNENVMLAAVLDVRGVPLDGLPDDRWALLVRGLLTFDHKKRWGGAEVRAWLDGGSPVVHGPVDQPGDRPRVRPFLFKGVQYTDERALARALLAEPTETARLLSGIPMRAPQAALLLTWLQSHGHDVQELIDSRVPSRTHAVLLTMLDPSAHPVAGSSGVSVAELPGLVAAAAAAGWVGPEAGVIESLHASGALGILSRLDGQDGLAFVQDAWQRWTFQVDTLVGRLPTAVRARGAATDGVAVRGLLLAAAARGDMTGPTLGTVPRDAREQQWFAELLRSEPGAGENAARSALALVTVDLAVAMTREQRAVDEERSRQEETRRRQVAEQQSFAAGARRARSVDQLLAWVALISSVVLPPVGLALGALSIRQSRRYGLLQHRRAWIAAVIGLLLTLSLLGWL